MKQMLDYGCRRKFPEDTKMKLVLAAVTLAAFTGIGFAQDNKPAAAAAPAAVAATAKPAQHAKKAAANNAEITMGSISAIDAAAKTITVKTSKGEEKTFPLKSVGSLTQGENVKVMVKNGNTTVKAIKDHAKKTAKSKKAAAK